MRVLTGTLGAGDDATGGLESTPVRQALVEAGPTAVPALRALLAGSPSPAAATSAAWVLGALRAHEEAPGLVQAMRRGALPPAAALHALAGAGTGADVPVVLEFVADRSPVVRGEALGAAQALLDPTQPDGRAVEPLAAALREARPSPAERARIATLLGRTGARRAIPLLVELTRAPDATLRIAAIDALGALGAAAPDAAPAAAGEDATGALLEAIASPDASIRLHAATALAEAGGAQARDALLARLDGGDEVDRAALLTALGGVLSRAPSDAAVARLSGALSMAAGPERDALAEALGRAPSAASVTALANLARSDEAADRRAAATMSAAHPGDAAATALARALVSDGDAGVRAQAAWALGSLGDASDLPRLAPVCRGADVDPAVDAVGALGRIAARTARPDLGAAVCPLASDLRPLVRANALAGLARAGARCGDGSPERAVLASDPSEDARQAAALAVARGGTPEDARALERCARTDASSAVAAICRAGAAREAASPRTHAVLVYVVPEGSDAPRPGAAYAMRFADGLVRAGITDRRGAVFEPRAPEGDVTLRRPGR